MLRLWCWLFSAWRRHEKQFIGDGNSGKGWMLRLGVGAAKVNDSLEMGFRQRMGAGGEGKNSFGDGIPAKVKKFFGEGISVKDGC